MGRTVTIVKPDRSIEVVENVPDNIDDYAVLKRYGGERIMTRGEDLARSAAAGPGFAVSQLATFPGKFSIGLRQKLDELGLWPIDEKDRAEGEKFGRGLHRMESKIAGALGGKYEPTTSVGNSAKAATAGAVGPPSTMIAGALGGILGQYAADQDAGPVGIAAASMLPGGIQAGLQAARPGTAFSKYRRALNELTPEQNRQLEKNARIAPETGVNPMPWQLAPENTALYNLGRGAALYPEAQQTQQRFQQQIPLTSTESVQSRLLDPVWNAVRNIPLTADQAERVHSSVRQVAPDRKLPRGSTDANWVERQAAGFGRHQDVPQYTPQQLQQRILQLQQQLQAMPQNQRAMSAAGQELRQLTQMLSGQTPIPTQRQFVPNVRDLGEVQSARQQADVGQPSQPNPSQGVRMDVRTAIRDSIDGYQGDVYRATLRRTKDLKDVTDPTGKSARELAGRNTSPDIEHSGRVTPASTAAYAAATSGPWAVVPIVRDVMGKVIGRDYDNLAQLDLASLRKRVQYDPQREALAKALLDVTMPIKLGQVGEE